MSDEYIADDVRDDEMSGPDSRRVAAIIDAIAAKDKDRLDALLEPLHAADIADVLEQISAPERRDLLQLWSGEIDGEILSEIDESIREEVVESLSPEVLSEAVRELDTDDVVDILENLDEPQQELILDALDDVDRFAVEQAMAFPEHSAGRLMQREIDALGRAPACVGLADVAFDETKARPLRRTDERADFVEVAPMPGGEIVEADDALIELEKRLKQVRADEAGDAGDEPGLWRGGKARAKPLVGCFDRHRHRRKSVASAGRMYLRS